MNTNTQTSITKIIASFLALVSILFSLAAAPGSAIEKRTVKNVIFMIGDGMGENHLEWAKKANSVDKLNMEIFPLRGQSETRSSSSSVTDSAAGGTALACGVRTTNGCVGVYNYDVTATFSHPTSLSEKAKELGKKVGIVTTDSTAGATPAAFSAHTSSRDNDKDISNQQIDSPFDIIWGKNAGCISKETAESKGFKYVSTFTELKALTPADRSYAQFDSDMWDESVLTGDTPLLSEMTEEAIALLSGTDEGFFLMVEGAHIDKNSHNNNADGMQKAVIEFDKAVRAALDFAEKDGNTLIVITADHETGGITYNGSDYEFTKTSHSGANVPLFVYGCDNFIKNGEAIKNTDVSKYTLAAMGVSVAA